MILWKQVVGLVLLLIAAPLVALPPPAGSEPLDRIVALVEDDVVLKSELDRAVETVRRQFEGRGGQLPPPEILERQVLERLILGKLQVQRAQQGGIRISDTEVDQAVGRIAAQNGVGVIQLRDGIEAQGLSFADFRQSVREELMAQRLRDRIIGSRASVSESEVDLLLASNQMRTGEVRLGHILVAVPENATPDQLRIAEDKINGIKGLIDRGEMDFTAAAIRYSDAPQALEGGEIGWRRYDQLPEALAEAVAAMQVGEVSRPLRSMSGFHLLKVLETRAESNVVIEEYRARHIVIDVDELTSEEEARAEIDNLRRQIEGGADFASLARQFSDDATTAPLGGEMDWFQLYAYGTAYGEVIQKLADGELSQPLRTERGWHLIQRLASRQRDRTTEYVREQARDSIRQRKGEEAFERFLRQLRNESFVEIRLAEANASG